MDDNHVEISNIRAEIPNIELFTMHADIYNTLASENAVDMLSEENRKQMLTLLANYNDILSEGLKYTPKALKQKVKRLKSLADTGDIGFSDIKKLTGQLSQRKDREVLSFLYHFECDAQVDFSEIIGYFFNNKEDLRYLYFHAHVVYSLMLNVLNIDQCFSTLKSQLYDIKADVNEGIVSAITLLRKNIDIFNEFFDQEKIKLYKIFTLYLITANVSGNFNCFDVVYYLSVGFKNTQREEIDDMPQLERDEPSCYHLSQKQVDAMCGFLFEYCGIKERQLLGGLPVYLVLMFDRAQQEKIGSREHDDIHNFFKANDSLEIVRNACQQVDLGIDNLLEKSYLHDGGQQAINQIINGYCILSEQDASAKQLRVTKSYSRDEISSWLSQLQSRIECSMVRFKTVLFSINTTLETIENPVELMSIDKVVRRFKEDVLGPFLKAPDFDSKKKDYLDGLTTEVLQEVSDKKIEIIRGYFYILLNSLGSIANTIERVECRFDSDLELYLLPNKADLNKLFNPVMKACEIFENDMLKMDIKSFKKIISGEIFNQAGGRNEELGSDRYSVSYIESIMGFIIEKIYPGINESKRKKQAKKMMQSIVKDWLLPAVINYKSVGANFIKKISSGKAHLKKLKKMNENKSLDAVKTLRAYLALGVMQEDHRDNTYNIDLDNAAKCWNYLAPTLRQRLLEEYLHRYTDFPDNHIDVFVAMYPCPEREKYFSSLDQKRLSVFIDVMNTNNDDKIKQWCQYISDANLKFPQTSALSDKLIDFFNRINFEAWSDAKYSAFECISSPTFLLHYRVSLLTRLLLDEDFQDSFFDIQAPKFSNAFDILEYFQGNYSEVIAFFKKIITEPNPLSISNETGLGSCGISFSSISIGFLCSVMRILKDEYSDDFDKLNRRVLKLSKVYAEEKQKNVLQKSLVAMFDSGFLDKGFNEVSEIIKVVETHLTANISRYYIKDLNSLEACKEALAVLTGKINKGEVDSSCNKRISQLNNAITQVQEKIHAEQDSIFKEKLREQSVESLLKLSDGYYQDENHVLSNKYYCVLVEKLSEIDFEGYIKLKSEIYFKYAHTFYKMNNYVSAKIYLNEAKKSLPKKSINSLMAARIYHLFGKVLVHDGKFIAAFRKYKAASAKLSLHRHTVVHEQLSEDINAILKLYLESVIGKSLNETDGLSKEKILVRALECLVGVGLGFSVEYATLSLEVAKCYIKQNNNKQALDFLETCHSIFSQKSGPEHSNTIEVEELMSTIQPKS